LTLEPEPIPERSLKVIELWNEGKSTGIIAGELGMTRSAVSGVVHRLRGRVAITRGHRPLTFKRPPPRPPRPPKVPKAPEPPPPPPEGLGIYELKNTSCRWPIEGVKLSMRYCGVTTYDPPYCEHHSSIAYAAPFTRLRR
jgi:hypothetical protein